MKEKNEVREACDALANVIARRRCGSSFGVNEYMDMTTLRRMCTELLWLDYQDRR